MNLVKISDPEGPQACRDLMDGMLLVAHLKNMAPSVIISAAISIVTAFSREMPHSQAIIAQSLRNVLAQIESGEFPASDHVIAQTKHHSAQVH